MRLFQGGLFHNPFRRDGTTNVLPPTPPSQPVVHYTQPTHWTRTFMPIDFWKTAYDQLDDEERRILSTSPISTNLEDVGNRSQTHVLISEVIRLTEEQYENYQRKANENLRASCQKIINAALSFKNLISTTTAFNPNQHVASAWAIVSLGLTMAKHHSDQRDALFESSEYLADVLTHCAFIEKHSYLNSSFSIKDDLGKAMTRLYTAILHYTAQIRKSQDPSTGRKLLDCVTAITEQPLTELKASVEKERDNIFRWIGLVKHLHHEKEAENILSQIDKLAESVQHLNEQLGLVNLRVAEGAFHDSYANEHEEFCLPDSRTELLSQILEWADSTEGQPIFWLNGVAGIGKSAIARIVARSLQDRGQLGATFFFKRDDADCGSARYLISTITRMLITRHRRLVPDVLSAIEDDPDISSKSLREQFDKLLFQPLLNLRLNPPITTVIVIDALDECDREDDIQVILRLLSRLQDVQSVRVRIFLTSRPELSIRLGLKQNNNHRVLVLHDLSESGIEHDIRLFLEHELSVIRDKRLLPLDWPGNENIEKLVKMAFPLFALAAIICRFIGDERGRPEKRLELLLQDQRASSSFQIGRTYLLILNQLLSGASEGEITQLKQEFRDIVGVIVLLATPLSVNALAQLIKLPRDDINTCLAGLHSVLSVGENIDIPVRILHSSFRDYLLLTESPFQVDQDEAHSKIASHCLRLMDTDLKHNICSLTSYGTQRVDIGNQVINQHIPAALEYACRYWVYHLQESKGRISESMVLSFLKQHFLHWLEVLSLAGNMSEAVGMVDALQSGIWSSMGAEILDFLYDARRFTLKNAYIASIAPLQLYCSGLAFAPMQSTIKNIFPHDVSKWIHTLPKVEELWSPALQTLECQSDSVESVAFSSGGSLLASGSIDQTITLWDVKTGNKLKTLKGHSDSIESVAFSHDELLLASGSIDMTIKLWDVETGKELQTLTGHSDWINSVAFSPDGKTLASGSYDKTIKIWDIRTGTELQTLSGHPDLVESVAFSPNGGLLASGCHDKTIKLWDTKTGKPFQTLIGHLNSVNSVTFAPDGQTLVSGSYDKTIKIWDIKTGKDLQTLAGHPDWISSVTFSSDGKTLASGSHDKTIKLWDIKTSKELQTLKGHSGWINSVAFSPDGQTLASGSRDSTIKIWGVETSKELQTLEGHSGWINSVAFSPDGQTVASGSHGKIIKIWDITSGKELQTLKGHSDWVNSVAFSPGGQMLASGSHDKTIKIWDIKSGKELQTLKGHLNWVYSASFSPGGHTLASGSGDKSIKLWDIKNGKELQTLTGHTDWINSVAFSPDGQTLASGSRDRTIKIWDIKSGKELQILKGHLDQVYSVAFSPDGQTLASGSGDKTIKVWGVKNSKELQTLTGHSGLINSVAFSPDGQTLASDSRDEANQVWVVKTSKELQTLTGHLDSVYSVAFSSDGQTLVSSSGDKTIKLWDVKSHKELQTLTGHSRSVYSVAFSSDRETLASGSGDTTIKIWDVKSHMKLRTLTRHSDWVNSVAFSPNGQTLASGSGDRTIKLWDVKTSKVLQTLTGHSDWINSVAFSPDGQILASGSHDKTIKIWDITSGNELQTLKGHSSWVYSVAFSFDGRTLASGSGDKTIQLWDTKTGKRLHSLIGHSEWVYSVAFSPDGQTLASSSYDKTIMLWNPKSGRKLHTLIGHSDWVYSVAFSPDGQALASGSGDMTIKIWDRETGKYLRTLTGHSNLVDLVAFLSDRRTLMSGSSDNTIRVWDIESGKELLTTKGYPASVHLVTNNLPAEGHGTRSSNTPLLAGGSGPSLSNPRPRVSLSNDWVAFGCQKVLWLPPEYRKFSCSAVNDVTLALGYSDGRVSIVGFGLN